MAEEFNQSRTEAPTQRRREEARQQGQVAVSRELSSGLLLLAGAGALWLGGAALAGGLLNALRLDLLGIHHSDFSPEQTRDVFAVMFQRAAGLVGFIVGFLLVVGVAVSALQSGVQFFPELALPRWERLSWANGWSRMVSLASGVRGLAAILKLGAVAGLTYWVLRGRLPQISSLCECPLTSVAVQAWNLVLHLALAIAAALVVVGLLDYLFQRWRHEQSIMMSRQELKDEVKREEGDPMLRARVRKLQREMNRRRMLEDVPRATVVITNPTHLAIAIRYERGTMPAPKVVAKGAGFLAQRIAERARRHAVPVVERQAVARALYKAVNVGQEIPTALYHAVAEVLAYVYKLRGAA